MKFECESQRVEQATFGESKTNQLARLHAGRTRPSTSVSLAWFCAWVALAGCEPDAIGAGADVDADVHAVDSEVDAREIPAGHPCPEIAFAPAGTAEWEDAAAVAPLALRLPTPLGLRVQVTQGNDGTFSHFGEERFAWDFGVPLDTLVYAAAGGVVVWMEDTRTSFGISPEFRHEANFIVLDHGGGLYTSYVHLEAGSGLVLPGDVVRAGDPLARTGLSGQMTGPHLHFQIENVWSTSVPARFATPLGCEHLPLQDETVVAWQVPLVENDVLSPLPPDTFEEDGVVDLVGLPARLLELDARPTVSGRTTLPGATDVYFLILPPLGGDAVFGQDFEVVDGVFEGVLDLSEVEPAQYGIAFVASTGGGVTVPRSVRAAVIQ